MIDGFGAPLPHVDRRQSRRVPFRRSHFSEHAFRLRGLFFTVGTLALSEAFRLLMINVPSFSSATSLFHDFRHRNGSVC